MAVGILEKSSRLRKARFSFGMHHSYDPWTRGSGKLTGKKNCRPGRAEILVIAWRSGCRHPPRSGDDITLVPLLLYLSLLARASATLHASEPGHIYCRTQQSLPGRARRERGCPSNEGQNHARLRCIRTELPGARTDLKQHMGFVDKDANSPQRQEVPRAPHSTCALFNNSLS